MSGDDKRFQRNAALLWTAQFISATGDAVFIPCVAWLASEGGSELSVGFAVFLAAVPYLVLGPLAGAWVDRTNRRLVMVASDLARAGLLIGLPWLAVQLGGLTYGLVVATALLLASFATPFVPARDALLPTLVGKRALPRWNAVMQTSGQLAMICGLGLGGLLMAGVEPGDDEVARVVTVLQLDGATFVVSALLLLMMRLPAEARTARRETHFLRDVRDGLTYAVKDPVVGGLLLLTALDNLAIMGPAIVGATLLVTGVFDLGAAELAWFEASMAGGMILGSTLLALRGRRWSMGRVVLFGMVLDGVTYLPFLWIPDYPIALVAIALHGVFIPMIVVGRTSLIQHYVPPDRHGKVFALVNITVLGMTALSAAASGWIAYVAGTRALFGIAGVVGALCGVVGWFWIGPRLAAVRTQSP